MSGIYIPDMKLPEKCGECPFFYDGEFEWCGRCNDNICDGLVDREGKPDWCDLVAVPDHGRLIDADALEEHDGWIRDSKYFSEQSSHTHIQFVFANDILDSPTIIPADGASISNPDLTSDYIKRWEAEKSESTMP